MSDSGNEINGGRIANVMMFNIKRYQLNFETFRPEKVNRKWIFPNFVNLKEKIISEGSEEYFEYELIGVVIHNEKAKS